MSAIHLLRLPHICIHNANALSSPFTIGFPAMTAWLGFMHALERKLNAHGFANLQLQTLAVVSHQCDLQTYKGANDYVSSIIGTGNPLNKDGSRPAFIEEARCHLDVSLVIEYVCYQENGDNHLPNDPQVVKAIYDTIMSMKMAGGDILSLETPVFTTLPSHDENGQAKRKLLNSLMPGYALIERRDLMIEAMNAGQDAMDALLEHLTVHHQCISLDESQFEWRSTRKTNGWIIPIATGFQGISPLGEAKNQRDIETPHRFAESIVTLGQFMMANKMADLDAMFWYQTFDLENDLYLCQTMASDGE